MVAVALTAAAAMIAVLVLVGVNFVHLVGKGSRLPAEGLAGVEALVAGAGADDAVVREDGEEVGNVPLGRVVDPALIGIGDDDHLPVLGGCGQAPFSASANLVEEILVLKSCSLSVGGRAR